MYNKEVFPSKMYLIRAANYAILVENMCEFSRNSCCIAKTGKFFYAASMFTMICVRANTLKKVLPILKITTDWDSTSIQSLARILIENCLYFLWFCEGRDTGDLADLKIHLIHYHDCIERRKIFELVGDEKNTLLFSSELIKLKENILKNQSFKKIPKDKNHFSKKELLDGRKPYFEKLSYIATKHGYEQKKFDQMYKYRSQFVHSFPISFQRLKTNFRGCGVHSQFEEKSICSSLSELNKILRKTFSAFKKMKKKNG